MHLLRTRERLICPTPTQSVRDVPVGCPEVTSWRNDSDTRIKHRDDYLLSPIFVVGPPRCGTTLLAKILGRHSRIFMPGETHFFDDIYSRRASFGDLQYRDSIERAVARLETVYGRFNEGLDQDRVDHLLHNREAVEHLRHCRTYRDLLSCFMELQMRSLDKARWGNNVPKDIFHVDDIVSFYSDAKILMCIRDVRDFLCSYKNKWTTASGENTDRLKRLYHPVLTSFLWRASVRQVDRIRGRVAPENLLIVRYESLVQDPARVVRDICRVIDEEFEDDMINVTEQNSSFETSRDGIFSSSVGRWRRALTQEEICTAQKIAGPSLNQFGYVNEAVSVNPIKLAHIWATVPIALFEAIHANRNIRGPLMPYLARRIGALALARR